MKLHLSSFVIANILISGIFSLPLSAQVLQRVELEAIAHPDDGLWQAEAKQSLLQSIDHSLRYIDTKKAAQDYAGYAIPEFSQAQVRRSLVRFRQLVQQAKDPDALQLAVQREFNFYQSTGTDGLGKVDFTAYFEPSYLASPVKTAEYQYPIYRQPKGFSTWNKPHPSRAELEGVDGLPAENSLLKGRELVWLSSRLQAYLVQVQGSARLQLTNGKTMTIGFDGSTDYPYVSLGKELINDGIFTPEELSLPKLMEYFETYPEKLSEYIPRNNRFIFFRETFGSPPTGSLGVPVTTERSIATDKSLMPPGAIAFISTQLPYHLSNGEWLKLPINRYVLDQDTGSAIKGAGRVDIFLGTGENIQERAGLVNDTGSLYYLLLKE